MEFENSISSNRDLENDYKESKKVRIITNKIKMNKTLETIKLLRNNLQCCCN